METPTAEAGTDGLCARIVTAIADATDEEPTTMSPPLYSAVDVDALSALVESTADVTVTFEYRGHEVVVFGDGSVRVDDRPTGPVATNAAESAEVLGGQR